MILVVCLNPSIDCLQTYSERFRLGAVNRVATEKKYPGGKGVHVAMAAAEMESKVKLLGFWGGHAGDWMRESCTAKGIEALGIEVEGENRRCITMISADGLDETEILGAGPKITPQDVERFLRLFRQHIKEVDVVVLSGSLPPGCPDDLYARLIEIGHASDVPTWIDCTGNPLKHALDTNPFGIHLNHKEALAYTNKVDLSEATAVLQQQVNVVALTRGSRGLVLSSAEDSVEGSVQVGHIYCTVGSGDCLVAGLAISTYHSRSLQEAARLAVAMGSANCMSTPLGLVQKAHVDELHKKIKIKHTNRVLQ
ncbi:MAG: hexose kinase [Reichenbachiella sp.]|uniref:1-phosphofructokinase family hexose kinase n=1 Tax=Reichenbachiella sp. TaxID=2184521 RepID=UPI003298B786